MLYSKLTGGFYDAAINGAGIPADAVYITESEYAAALSGQSDGGRIKPDASGKPYVEYPSPPTLEQVKGAKLAQLEKDRDAAETALITVHGKTYNPSEKVTSLLANLGARLRRGKPTTLSAMYEANGTPVSPVTQQLIEAVEDAIAAQREAAWNRYGTLIGQVQAAATVEQVDAIVW